MAKWIFLSVSLFVLASCGKQEAPAGPSDAVLATFNALNAHDSVAFVQSLSEDKRETYETNPQALSELLGRWKGRHADVSILSVKNQGDTLATILYNLKISGAETKEHDSLITRTYFENGEWKHGY
ncbi:MAG TPA: hypothetical protein VG537_03820 [Candidatus Kapabacteria bacterium]|jgi:hypothetical protein|nr:hypothetical protein [Candidatus Kapabacteria bacterium]